ncbi:MAG: phospho-N-acetylmuramoyl-pentapeptide-transferase [Candidatus Firestonebacteria bacterium]
MLYYLLYPLRDVWHVFNVFKYSTFRSIYAALTAILICFIIGPYVIKKLKTLHFGQSIRTDGPKSHHVKSGTPTMGGIIIIFAIVISTLLWAKLDNRLVLLALTSLVWFGSVGAIDDLLKITKKNALGLSMRTKVIGQLIGAFGIGMYLYVNPQVVEFATHIKIPLVKYPVNFAYLYVPFIMLVIIGASNAVNLTDGLDGLAIGTFIFTAMSFVIVTYIVGHSKFSEYLRIIHVSEASELVVFCASMVGASLGFLWFNAYPAQVFMGDTGALALGGALGTVAVLIKQELLLILIGGIFVIEALSVILQILSFKLYGKRIFLMAPLHHHFELSGWAEPKIVVRFWIITIICTLLSLSLLKLR